MEVRLSELFGPDFINKVDYEKLVEENIEYIAHILGECECFKLKNEGICVIRKDANKKLKVKYKNGFETVYSL